MEIIDISMKIGEDIPVYPGNPEPEIERYREVPGDSTTESKICIGSHTGTHVDSEQHVFQEGSPVSEMELENFYGECQVLDLTDAGKEVTRDDLEEKDIRENIILVKTRNSGKQYENFREEFTGLKLDAVKYLIENDVETIGVDYLSLTVFYGGEEDQEAHRLGIREMKVIEGLKLTGVEPGKYRFAGFPVKIESDGAPVRAVLIDRE